ncbi:hypothetical protein GCM10027185_38500 [Spirosoma pulveris]
MVGRAIFTMLLSRVDMNVPNMTVPRIIHLLGNDDVVAETGGTDTEKWVNSET